ncbi:hypothetical protein LINGRAHAP2_LOCUS23010 [Linum grandiflorum]
MLDYTDWSLNFMVYGLLFLILSLRVRFRVLRPMILEFSFFDLVFRIWGLGS